MEGSPLSINLNLDDYVTCDYGNGEPSIREAIDNICLHTSDTHVPKSQNLQTPIPIDTCTKDPKIYITLKGLTINGRSDSEDCLLIGEKLKLLLQFMQIGQVIF